MKAQVEEMVLYRWLELHLPAGEPITMDQQQVDAYWAVQS